MRHKGIYYSFPTTRLTNEENVFTFVFIFQGILEKANQSNYCNNNIFFSSEKHCKRKVEV